jgi:hypothetical protein
MLRPEDQHRFEFHLNRFRAHNKFHELDIFQLCAVNRLLVLDFALAGRRVWAKLNFMPDRKKLLPNLLIKGAQI